MRPGTEKLRAKATRALGGAAAALDAGAIDVAAGRAFYAVLNAAKARLNEHGQRLYTHARIAAAYAALPAIGAAPAQVLHDALALRRQLAQDGDALSYEDVARLLDAAAAFVAAAVETDA
jgi:hypothetical protein